LQRLHYKKERFKPGQNKKKELRDSTTTKRKEEIGLPGRKKEGRVDRATTQEHKQLSSVAGRTERQKIGPVGLLIGRTRTKSSKWRLRR